MARKGRFGIRNWCDPRTGQTGISFFCPGCQSAHSVPVAGGEPGRNWTFNGDFDNPTLSPSIRVYVPAGSDKESGETWPERTECHSFVRNGEIEFLDDSAAHSLRGVHPLQPWPESYGFAGED